MGRRRKGTKKWHSHPSHARRATGQFPRVRPLARYAMESTRHSPRHARPHQGRRASSEYRISAPLTRDAIGSTSARTKARENRTLIRIRRPLRAQRRAGIVYPIRLLLVLGCLVISSAGPFPPPFLAFDAGAAAAVASAGAGAAASVLSSYRDSSRGTPSWAQKRPCAWASQRPQGRMWWAALRLGGRAWLMASWEKTCPCLRC